MKRSESVLMKPWMYSMKLLKSSLKNVEFKANADEHIVHILAELAPSSVTRQGKGDSLPWTLYSSAYSKHASLLELQMPMSYLLTEKNQP